MSAAPATARCPFEDDVLVLSDGDLAPQRRMIVEAHLGVCSSCAAIDESMEQVAATLLAAQDVPLGAADAALARIDAVPVARPALRVAAVAAAVVAAAVIAAVVLRPGGTEPGRRENARETARDPRAPATTTAEDTPAREPATPPSPAVRDDLPSPEGPPSPIVPHVLDDLRDQVAALDPDAPADDRALAAAVRRVRAAGTAGAAALADLLDAGDRDVAVRAIRVAADVRSSQFVAPLGRLLGDDGLAADAADALAAIDTTAGAEQLVAAPAGPSRRAALDALARCRTPRAFDAVAARLRADDRTTDEASALLDVAVSLDPKRAARLILDLAASEEAQPAADRVLRARSGDLVPILLPMASKGDGLVAAAAVRALGRTGDPSAVPALRTAGSRPALARPAVEALVSLGTDAAYAAAFDIAADPRSPRTLLAAFDRKASAAAVLARALADPRAARRLAAIEAMGWTRADTYVAQVAGAAQDAAQRRAGVEALGRIGGDEAAALLAEWSRPRGADVALVVALGATGSEAAVPALRTLARESALAVPATQALGEIAERESVFALADLLAEPRTSRAAAYSLAGLPAGVVVPALVERLDEPAAAGRAHRALVLVSGSDLGRAPDAWRTWWDARRPRTPEERR